MRKQLLPAIVISASLLLGAFQPAGASERYAKVIVGQAQTYAASNKEGYGGDVPYRVLVSRKALYEGSTTGVPNPMDVSCSGGVCFGVGIVNGFQYPLMSLDGRKTWRNGGHWFAGPWADAAGFTTKFKVLSSSVAVAWDGVQDGITVTGSAGRVWYGALFNGPITAASSSDRGKVITLHVGANKPETTRYVYQSTDGGAQWKLIS